MLLRVQVRRSTLVQLSYILRFVAGLLWEALRADYDHCLRLQLYCRQLYRQHTNSISVYSVERSFHLGIASLRFVVTPMYRLLFDITMPSLALPKSIKEVLDLVGMFAFTFAAVLCLFLSCTQST